MSESLLHTEALSCGYGNPILQDIDIELAAGEFVLLEGPNGIGKSTFIKTLAGVISPVSGQFDWTVEAKNIRFVPQTRTLEPILPATVRDVVETGQERGWSWLKPRQLDKAAVEKALSSVGMAGKADDLFRNLSEGQKQLVSLARAICAEPDVLLLDEPTASMDPEKEARTIHLLSDLVENEGITILMIAHGSEHARQQATCLLEIDSNRDLNLERKMEPPGNAT